MIFQIHLDLVRYHELGRFVEKSVSVYSEKENVYSTKDYENKKNKGTNYFAVYTLLTFLVEKS